MKNFHKQKDYWKPCRPGTIRQVSDSKFQRERRQFIVRATMGSVVAGLGLLVGAFAISHDRRMRTQNSLTLSNAANVTQIRLSCNEIMEQLDDYVDVIEIADTQRSVEQRLLVANFKQHLAVCKVCTGLVDDAMQS